MTVRQWLVATRGPALAGGEGSLAGPRHQACGQTDGTGLVWRGRITDIVADQHSVRLLHDAGQCHLAEQCGSPDGVPDRASS